MGTQVVLAAKWQASFCIMGRHGDEKRIINGREEDWFIPHIYHPSTQEAEMGMHDSWRVACTSQ